MQIRKLIAVIQEVGRAGPGGQPEVSYGLLFKHTENTFEVPFIARFRQYCLIVYTLHLLCSSAVVSMQRTRC